MSSRWLLVHVVCAAALLFQLGHVLEGYIHPTVTNTGVEERDLKDLDFPVMLKVCATPGFNESALREVGYGSVLRYFEGTSMYNKSIVGWAGHSNSSEGHGSVAEVLNKVRSHTFRKVVNSIWMKTSQDGWNEITNITNVIQRRVNYPANCYTLDFTNVADVKENGVLYIYFTNEDGRSIDIIAEGSSLNCDRLVKAHRAYSDGDTIAIETNHVVSYVVEMNKNVYVEEDPNINCRNYPNSDFASYRDCDDQYMREYVASHDPGLVPIWLADDMKKVTSYQVERGGHNWFLFDGTKPSDCPLPCSTTHTKTKFLEKHIPYSHRTMLALTFSPTVKVTTTDFVSLELSTFLSDVGGSIGLWLGLGVLQAAEMVVKFLLPTLWMFGAQGIRS
jgi:hypothetical protein